MNSQPIDFDEDNKDPVLRKIIRKSFRIPFNSSETVWVEIEKNRYPIRDVCMDGIGITLDDPAEFSVSQIVMGCELNIAGELIKGLNGRVIHFSMNSGKDWQCGIQWTNITDADVERMTGIVSKLKQEFLIDEDQTD